MSGTSPDDPAIFKRKKGGVLPMSGTGRMGGGVEKKMAVNQSRGILSWGGVNMEKATKGEGEKRGRVGETYDIKVERRKGKERQNRQKHHSAIINLILLSKGEGEGGSHDQRDKRF